MYAQGRGMKGNRMEGGTVDLNKNRRRPRIISWRQRMEGAAVKRDPARETKIFTRGQREWIPHEFIMKKNSECEHGEKICLWPD